jgi:hypothetical protein
VLGILIDVPLFAFRLEFCKNNLSSTSPSISNPIYTIHVITVYTVSEEEKLFPMRQNFSYYAFLVKRENKTECI